MKREINLNLSWIIWNKEETWSQHKYRLFVCKLSSTVTLPCFHKFEKIMKITILYHYHFKLFIIIIIIIIFIMIIIIIN